jgi:o-succinylbenzoate synthase
VSSVRAALRAYGGPLAAPLESAHGRLTSREGLLLTLTDADGRVGRGECSPLPGYSRETLAECRTALERWIASASASLSDPLLPPAAQCAIESAELDLRGQQTGAPVHALLAAQPARPVPLSALLTGATADDLQATAERLVAEGFRTLKLKLGLRPFPEELQLLRAIRRAVGDEVALRLDANQAFAPEAALEHLRALAEVRPEFVEEPSTSWFAALADSPVPLAMDESLQSPLQDLQAVTIPKVLIVKPMLWGRPSVCVQLARGNLDLVVTHTWDGPYGLAIAAATALAIGARFPSRLRACGLARHAGLTAWPSIELPFLRATEIVPTGLPGLGLEWGER